MQNYRDIHRHTIGTDPYVAEVFLGEKAQLPQPGTVQWRDQYRPIEFFLLPTKPSIRSFSAS